MYYRKKFLTFKINNYELMLIKINYVKIKVFYYYSKNFIKLIFLK